VPYDRPFALVAAGEKGVRLTAVNAPAGGQGLFPGLSLADARARCPHLVTAPATPERDAAALARLARWCGRYSPSLNIDGERALWIDATGSAHLFGGLDALAIDLETRLARLGFTARTGCGSTLGAAWARARFSPPERESSLAALPIEGLRLSPETIALLKRLGLRRIGDLELLPRAALKRRFPSRAAAEAVLARLDQAFGRRDEPRAPLAPPPSHVAWRVFAEPLISSAGVEAALETLGADLAARLGSALQGARQVTLALYRADGTSARVRAGFGGPCRDADHFTRLLKEKIKDVDAGFGVDCLTLSATAVEGLGATQGRLAGEHDKASPQWLIDRLANRLSAACVFTLTPRASHIPERADERCAALAPRVSWRGARPLAPLRPAFLLARPEPIAVIAEVPEGPPLRFTWRRLTLRVIRAQGPERIAPEWWRALAPARDWGTDKRRGVPEGHDRDVNKRRGVPEGHDRDVNKRRGVPEGHDRECNKDSRPRDYYRIEDAAGGRYWVFREGLYQAQGQANPPRWFLHGLFG